jgi:murein DD-endopeptidase MepM/ murein hydrolase activator NlpD
MRVTWVAIGFLWAVSAGAETLYRLPWGDGLSFMFTQVPGGRITTHFTKATLHAVDIAMPEGMPVAAARDGVVEAADGQHRPTDDAVTYEGNFVRVRHDDGTVAIYAHLKHGGLAVSAGDKVAAGQLLGYSGGSGDVDAPHLHFAVTRTEKNSAGWLEEVSLPVRFHVGVPPLAFSPRPALRVTANYSGPADMPRAPSETRMFAWEPPALKPGEEPGAWARLALWLSCGIAAIIWFWKFSSS